jgi:hypothetical protein
MDLNVSALNLDVRGLHVGNMPDPALLAFVDPA